MSRNTGLGDDFNPFASLTRDRPKGQPKKAARRTLSVPKEIGELVADAAAYHERKVSAFVVELLSAGLEQRRATEAKRLDEPSFAYPKRIKPK